MSLAIVLASCNSMQQQSVHRIITKKVQHSSCTRSLCRAFMFLSFYHMRHREHGMFLILKMELLYFYLIYFSGMIVLAVPVRLSLGLTLVHGRNSMEFFRIRWKKSLLTLLFLCFVDDRFSSRQPSISLLPFFHF